MKENEPVLFNFDDLEQQAQKYLDAVRQEAREIIQNAVAQARKDSAEILKEAEKIRSDAHRLGHEDGYAKGYNAGVVSREEEIQIGIQNGVAQELPTAAAAIQNIARNLREVQASLTNEWQRAFLRLVCAVARQIVRRELQKDPSISENWIRETLELCSGENQIVLRLHPSTITTLKTSIKNIQTEFHKLGRIEIKPDDTLLPGECVLETEFGRMDQRIEAQLRRIMEELE
ncbi:MAG: FliH/SctL family protein [Planctomycetia bacterium]|nr:FliH/SctL family protein [Planctomycetia bacterium]